MHKGRYYARIFFFTLLERNYQSWQSILIDRLKFRYSVNQAISNHFLLFNSISTKWVKVFTLRKKKVLKLTTLVPKSLFSKTYVLTRIFSLTIAVFSYLLIVKRWMHNIKLCLFATIKGLPPVTISPDFLQTKLTVSTLWRACKVICTSSDGKMFREHSSLPSPVVYPTYPRI